uniref:Matrin-type domain-containing protein n=1 Tax=Oryzias latipes TaxID=8090 RepID=A0A3P9JHW5_ORYLA
MTQKTGAQTDGEPPSSQSGDAASADAITDNDTTTSKNALKNLDEVSEEEEDYPDDTAEEEELNKRLAAAKERERAREERRAHNGENREQKGLSCSRGRSHRSKEEEKVDLDTQELVTLDEVGGDEAGEPDFEGLDSGVMERELQDLVTLDEIIEEEVEEGKEAQTHETQPRIQDSQSEDLIKPEVCELHLLQRRQQLKLTSAGSEESTITDEPKSGKEAAEKSPRAAKRKHDEDAGQEHVVPKSGFFCNICSVFYLTEKAAKEIHCSSQRHYENLQLFVLKREEQRRGKKVCNSFIVCFRCRTFSVDSNVDQTSTMSAVMSCCCFWWVKLF